MSLFIATSMQFRPTFQPRFSGYRRRDEIEHVLSAVKSLIELVAMKERYQALQRSPQSELVYLLFSKVAEESCKWVRTCNYEKIALACMAMIMKMLLILLIYNYCRSINRETFTSTIVSTLM